MLSTVTEWIDEILSSASIWFYMYKTDIACGPVFNVLENQNESWTQKRELKVINLLFEGNIFFNQRKSRRRVALQWSELLPDTVHWCDKSPERKTKGRPGSKFFMIIT